MNRHAKGPAGSVATRLAVCLLASFIAQRAHSGQVSAPDKLPVYPGAKRVHVPEQLSANRVPIGARIFSTRDDIDSVLAFYRNHMNATGRKLAEKRFNPGFGYVGYYDEASGNMITVTAIEAARGMTLIVLSAMNPLPLLGRPGLPEFIPVPPEADGLTITGGAGPDDYPIAVSYDLPGLRPDGCRSKLMELAGRHGWKQTETIGSRAGTLLQFERGTLSATVQLQAGGSAEKPACKVSLVVVSRDENEKIPRRQTCEGGMSP